MDGAVEEKDLSSSQIKGEADRAAVFEILSGTHPPRKSPSNGVASPEQELEPEPRGSGVTYMSSEVSTTTEDKSKSGDVVVSSSESVVAQIGVVISKSVSMLRGESTDFDEQKDDEGEGDNVREEDDKDGDEDDCEEEGMEIDMVPSDHFQNEVDMTTRTENLLRGRSYRRATGSSPPIIDFLQDKHSEMTLSRRLALYLMTRKRWYYPRLGKATTDEEEEDINEGRIETKDGDKFNDSFINCKDEPPSLEKAWAYFEHATLPRYIVRPKRNNSAKKSMVRRAVRKMSKGKKKLERAEPGENKYPTKLYSPIFTPLDQMGDFGIGVGLYFATLRAVTIITLIAGLISVPNMVYFSSDEYSDGQPGVTTLLKGSAICTRTEWVPCPTCTEEDFKDESHRLVHIPTDDGQILKLARKNLCDGATLQQGLVSFITMVFVIVSIILLTVYQKKKQVRFDEDEQTAQDYSIMITNPPHDATDPDEWRTFFFDNFDGARVTVCTVALDNDLLVRSLVERRERLMKLKMMLPTGTSMDVLNLARIAAAQEGKRKFFYKLFASIIPGVPEHFGRLVVLNAKIQGLAQQSYPCTNVFITFETEAAQRRVLKSLTVGSLASTTNKTNAIAVRKHLFRGERVLAVHESDEPSTIRWQDLNERLIDKVKQMIFTTLVSVCAVILIAFIVSLCNDKNATFAAFAISISNISFPQFAKLLTSIEAHSSEGGKQTSLYLKIAAFRWVNTAIVITIITPFTSTITNGAGHLIQAVYAIFFAEIVTINAIQLADLYGHFKRHIMAPRAKSQDGMNMLMQGTMYELAERYTNMTKILFLALWYSAIYPAALFMCSFALFINFFTDRFSLMRTWTPAPKLGTKISNFSRRYFFSTCIVTMAVISSYYWAGFPYDNLCLTNSTAGESYDGHWSFTTNNVTFTDVSVDYNGPAYQFCSQDLLRTRKEKTFPAWPRFQPEGLKWMTSQQETLTQIYGTTSLVVLGLVCVLFGWSIYKSTKGIFIGRFSPTGEDQGINFSDVPSISSYIPEVKSSFFSYPLVAAQIQGVDEDLFEWEDPDKPYSYYDLTHDAEELLQVNDVTRGATKNVFSKVKHWPPDDTIEEAA